MARHTGGWVKLFRNSLKHPIMGNFEAFGLFCALIQMANHEPSRVKFSTGIIELRAGEILTSRRELARLMTCAESTAERRLKWLETCGSIGQRSDRQGRIITILNWDQYQVTGDQPRTANRTTTATTIGQRSDNDRTTTETPSGEVEKLRREEIKEVGGDARARVDPQHPPSHVKGLPPEWLLALWNSLCGELAKTTATASRLAKAAEALAANPDREFWNKAIAALSSSDFARGKKPGRDGTYWRASFDWLLKDDHAKEAALGTYDDHGKKVATSQRDSCPECGGRGWVLAFRNEVETHFGCPLCPWPAKNLAPFPAQDEQWSATLEHRGWTIKGREERHG